MDMKMEPITAFRDQYVVFSNFYRIDLVLDGMIFPTLEHAFQAAKTLDWNDRRFIQQSATPGTAKIHGRKVKLRTDWDEVKIPIMRELLEQKFGERSDNFILRVALRNSFPCELIEGNTWGDKYWGCVPEDGQWVGENMLGKLLMEIRDTSEKSCYERAGHGQYFKDKYGGRNE